MLAHITTGPRPAQPDAFKIKKCGQSTYADILGIIKGAADLKDLQERVTRIRRTKAGELLLEMCKTNVVTPVLQTLVSSTLAWSAIVQVFFHKETVNIKDLDETTTAEEVAQAITPATGPGIVTAANIKLRASYSGTQAANVLLPVAATKKLMKTRKLRIAWVNCRVRLRETVTRCFKCHEIGHLAWNCKSAVDQSSLCFRCRTKGHKAVNCPTIKGQVTEEVDATHSNNG